MTIPIAFPETSKQALPLNRNMAVAPEPVSIQVCLLPHPRPAQEDLSWERLALQAAFRPALLAKLCNVSLRTLERHFRKRYSVTVSSWLHKLRMARSYELIRSGESVKSAAYQLGFKQLSHFSRAFKATHGIPPRLLAAEHPSAFRRLLAGELAFASSSSGPSVLP